MSCFRRHELPASIRAGCVLATGASNMNSCQGGLRHSAPAGHASCFLGRRDPSHPLTYYWGTVERISVSNLVSYHSALIVCTCASPVRLQHAPSVPLTKYWLRPYHARNWITSRSKPLLPCPTQWTWTPTPANNSYLQNAADA